jgi:hypothetical protein
MFIVENVDEAAKRIFVGVAIIMIIVTKMISWLRFLNCGLWNGEEGFICNLICELMFLLNSCTCLQIYRRKAWLDQHPMSMIV